MHTLGIALLSMLGSGSAAYRVTLAEPNHPGASVERMLKLDENGHAGWRPQAPFALSFGENLRIDLDRMPEREHEPLEVRLRWKCTGPEDVNRRFRVMLRVLDDEGNQLHTTWSTEVDNRIGPIEVQFGSRKGIRSTENYPRFEIPAWALPRCRTIAIEMATKDVKELRNVAPHPSEIGLTITRPDANGAFDLIFTNPNYGTPDAWNLQPDKHQVVVTLSRRDAKPMQHLLEARVDGNYGVRLKVDKQHFEEATVSVVFWTKQPDHDAFVKRFLEQGQGGGYSGLWHQESTPLTEVQIVETER